MRKHASLWCNDFRKLHALLLVGMYVSGCSGGDENICSTSNAESAAVQALNQENITKDPCQTSFAEADAYGNVQDARIRAQLPITPKYDQEIARLKQKASIHPDVPIRVVTDIQAYLSMGGGVTGHNLIYVDGKLLDILEEYSNFLAVSATTRFNPDPRDVLNQIVADHSLIPGVNIPAKRFSRTSLDANVVPWLNSSSKSYLGQ